MSKFNTAAIHRPAVFSPITSEQIPSGVTHQGGDGYARDTRSKLFLLAVSNMVGENTFYETGPGRDDRYAALVRAATLADPDWTLRLLWWLRRDANMRTAALVGAAEFAKARLDAGLSGLSRQVVDGVMARADEPGEFLAYWTGRFGRALPKPVKRGVADAAVRLYNEWSWLKWDSAGRAFRFGDVLDLVHPKPSSSRQGVLFGHILDDRHGHVTDVPEVLSVVEQRDGLLSWPVPDRRVLFERADAAERLASAGMTWESVAGWLQGPMTAQVWEALIPSMGYMALLRNLRNFDEAGVSDRVAEHVAARLADPEQVARSRQLPMRFLSAYNAVPSSRWAWPLEQALRHSLSNVPALSGRTLILVDTSGSMSDPFSKDSSLKRWDAAVVFGLGVAARCEHADVVSYSSAGWGGKRLSVVFPRRAGESLLRSVVRWKAQGYFIGGGTDTPGAIRANLRPGFHDRLVVVTDEQSTGDVAGVVPAGVSMYTWNLAGYRHGHAPSGATGRHVFAGLSDQAFRMIPLLEAGRDAAWPF